MESGTGYLQYLLDYLEEEFQRYPVVRVRVPPGQRQSGVSVKTEAREYFFPELWVETRRFDRISQLVQQIKEVIERH